MLEKNKDYLEMRVSSTDYAFTQNAPTQISVDGHVYTPYMDLPTPGEFYILISKEKFEKLQAEIEHYKRDVTRLQSKVVANAELARQMEINYDSLLKKTGFDTVTDLVNYLNDAECDTLHEAISKLDDEVKYTSDKWASANRSNNSWKAAAELNSPKELIEKLSLLRDDISGRSTVIESAISWHHAYNKVIDKNRKLEEENADLYAEIRKWKDSTKCEKPEAAATWITSYESACERGNRLAEMVEKLKEEVDSWKNVTGFSTPEKCSSYIGRLEKKLEDIKNLTEED